VQARERGVSRRHAALLSFEDTLHVLDIQSANGTFINGRRIMPLTPHPLVTGDVVRFGGVELVLTEGS
jgi:S-DNA-T family DNA segregation ATPase FtsK/SpoIIIE